MKAKQPIETEIKLRAGAVKAARERLRRAGFRVHKRRVFEDNIILDTPELRLRNEGALLRLRRVGRDVTLTYKGKEQGGRHKSREEREVSVANWDATVAIAERIGLARAFRYQKYRTEYKLPRGGGVATLDETPIGVYFELEGSPAWIDRTARNLAFRESDYITDSYGSLYLKWCKERKKEPGDMVFKKEPRP